MANHMNKNPKTGKKRGTKAALAASFAALLLCGATLVGTTFAWFTDTATTGNNTIKAGELNVVLEKWDEDKGEYVSVENENGTGIPVFNATEDTKTANSNSADTLWEPGKTQVEYFRIKNEGNLALKYQVWLNTEDKDGEQDLYKAMQYQIKPNAKLTKDDNGTIQGKVGENELIAKDYKGVTLGNHNVSLPGADGNPADGHLAVDEADVNTHYFALAVNMKEGAGNEYMNGEVQFELSIHATQDTVESDSFDETYDEQAMILKPKSVTSLSETELNFTFSNVNQTNPTTPGSVQMTYDTCTCVYGNQYMFDGGNPDNWYAVETPSAGDTIFYKADGTQDNVSYVELESYRTTIKTTLSALEYGNYNVDLVVKFDEEIPADKIQIVSPVEDASSTDLVETDVVKLGAMEANEEIRILNKVLEQSKTNDPYGFGEYDNTYADVVSRYGIVGLKYGINVADDADVSGTTATFELRLYNTDEHGNETGAYSVMHSDRYTFS